MKTIKCEYCGEEKLIRGSASSYVYKLRLLRSMHICYFCSYGCMQKDEKENPEKYGRKRNNVL